MRPAALVTSALLVGALVGSVPPSAGQPIVTASVVSSAEAAVPTRLRTWHLAPSLAQLRAEIDARWPGRSRASDGSIGDTRHASTRNSHNPVGTKHGPRNGTRGAVHALDITASGIDTSVVLAAVIGDPRVWYVIYNGRIWSRTSGWSARRHVGDPHRTHIHVSLRDDTNAVARAAERSTARWLSARSATRGSRAARLTTAATHQLQRALIRRGYRIPSGPTGWYGPETTKAVQAYQRDQGWSGAGADGIAGSTTLRRLGVTGGSSSASKAAAKKTAAKRAAAKRAAAKRAAAKKAAAKRAAAKRAAAKRATAKAATAKKATQQLQRALIRQGYRIPSGATGWYGPETTKAVRAFQQDQGWTGAGADGIAGSTTLRRLGVPVSPGSFNRSPAAGTAAAKAAAKKAAAKKAAAQRAAAKKAAAKRVAAKRAAAKAAAAKRAAAKRAAAKKAAAQRESLARVGAYKPGTASTQVYHLQAALIERGFAIPAGPTGYFGPHTQAAVKAFQRSQGWSGKDADGVPGTGTLRELGLI